MKRIILVLAIFAILALAASAPPARRRRHLRQRRWQHRLTSPSSVQTWMWLPLRRCRATTMS